MTGIKITDWYLVRHGPVQTDQPGLYPHENSPIDTLNDTDLEWLAGLLPDDADWHVSQLSRAHQTATALRTFLRAPGEPRADHRLNEQSFGDWYGLSFDALWPLLEPLPAHNWSILAAETVPPNGSSFMQVWAQITAFLEEFERRDQGPQIVVAHAGTIRAFVGNALGLTPETALALCVDTLSLTHLRHQSGTGLGGQWQLVTMNRKPSA